MNLPPRFRKFLRLLLAFLAIYVVWSIYINVANLDRAIDDEALLPCLFYLPPLGILGISIILVKVIQLTIFMRVIKMIRNRLRKKIKKV